MADKYFRDPVHGSIRFDKDREKLIIDLVNTREFQRLRRIRQLGALYLTFHGAEHTRFTHSIGTAFMAKRIFDSLLAAGQVPQRPRAAERTRLVSIVAALLHDVGHGPFSHLYEKVFDNRRHEDWTRAIVCFRRGEVGRLVLHYPVQPRQAEGDVVAAGDVADVHVGAAAPGDDGQPLRVGVARHLRDLLVGGRGHRRMRRQAVDGEGGELRCEPL